MISAAIYDPQPPGSTSGPIRWVQGFTSAAAVTACEYPCAVISGSNLGVGGATHHVVDGEVVPLNGAAPAEADPIMSPHPAPDPPA